MSRATLTNIYYGRSKGIQLDTLTKLCSFLEVTPNDLIISDPVTQ
ncbi:helix-turn-helix domain-containing protein [Secundilactobacillus silagei]